MYILQVSQFHGTTGSDYIFLNIAGELHGYSLTTGLRVLRSNDGSRKRTSRRHDCASCAVLMVVAAVEHVTGCKCMCTAEGTSATSERSAID